MKKQLLRVKQIADQTFLRAEKSEVLTEDLVNAEKRVDIIKQAFQVTQKKIASCQIDFGSEASTEKRQKKVPQVALAAVMLENGYSFSKNSILGNTLKECASTQAKLGNELLEYYSEIEKSVMKPISCVLETEIHNINKLRKQLGKLTLDMDSARNRYLAAEKHSGQANVAAMNSATAKGDKVDTLKDELEEASQKVEQCRDALAAEMFSLIAKESQLSQIFVNFHKVQADYHRNALEALQCTLPILEKELYNFPQKPVYGCLLEEHLRVTNRKVSNVIETCVSFLMDYGVTEEGLLRVAGSISKLKKLKSALDAGLEVDMTEYIRDPHVVSGALKSYLRELPEPLMTFALYDEWLAVANSSESTRVSEVCQLVHKLPEVNFINLRYVIKFLSKVLENSEANKMSSQNIAIVMAPNIIWSPIEDINLGSNMCSASLHNTIVEALVSNADYIFPDSESPYNPKAGKIKNTEVLVIDTECENDIITSGQLIDASACSPKSVHKNNRKHTAPPPPPPPNRKAYNDRSEAIPELLDITEETSAVTTGNLLSAEGTVVSSKTSDPSNAAAKDLLCPKTVVRRRSNEHITLSGPSPIKGDRPNVPEKPQSYSAYSLDRKQQRMSYTSKTTASDKVCEYIPRAQRPSVPPPERPSKPSRFSTIENYATDFQLPKEVRPYENVPEATKKDESTIQETLLLQDDVQEFSQDLKPHQSPTLLPKGSSKQNRFDFLVAQTIDKPPERPPRSIPTTQDLIECTLNDPLNDSSNTTASEKSLSNPSSPNNDIHIDQPITTPLKSPETEKPKPPRPQPPVPFAKPKINLGENTNL